MPVVSRRTRLDFPLFWSAQTVSTLGDALAALAMPLLTLQLGGSLVELGVVTALFGAGQWVAGSLSGALVDSADRKRLMVGCDLVQGVLFSGLALATTYAPPGVALRALYVVSALAGAIGMLNHLAGIVAVRGLVPPEELMRANGRLSITDALGSVAGPLLLPLVASAGAGMAMAVNGASFFLSGLALLGVRMERSRGAELEPPEQRLLAGGRFLAGHGVLRWVAVLLVGYHFLFSSALNLLVFRLEREFGLDKLGLALVFAAASTGGALGGLVASALRRRLGFGVTFLGSLVVTGLSAAAAGMASRVPLLALCAAVHCGAVTVHSVCSVSLRQELTPPALLGRVTAALWSLTMPARAAGAAVLMSLVAPRVGVPAVMGLIGLAGFVVALVGARGPLPGREDAVAPELEPGGS